MSDSIQVLVHLFQSRLQRTPPLPVHSEPRPDAAGFPLGRRRRRLRLLLADEDVGSHPGPAHRAAVHESDKALPARARVPARKHRPRDGILLADDAQVVLPSLVADGAVLVDVELLQDCDVSRAVLEVRGHDLGLELNGGVPDMNHVEDGADVTTVLPTIQIFVGWHGADHNRKARARGSP